MNRVHLFRRAVCAIFFVAAALVIALSAQAAPVQQANSCLNAPGAVDPTASVCISNVIVPFNGTSRENQFVVSWRTENNVPGSVKVAGSDTFDDVRGADYRGKTHYVVVSNLGAKKTYTFDLVSGGETYTNGGAHWTVKLGPAIETTIPYIVRGRVKNPDGTDAEGALVYAQVRDGDDQGTSGRSGLLSSVISTADGGDFFNINLEPARTQNNNTKFEFTPETDRVLITAIGADGKASKQFKITDLHPPKAPPSLTLGDSGTGSVATATPTRLPTETYTPSPSPSPTDTSTLVPPTPTRTRVRPTRSLEPLPTDTPNVPPTFQNVPTIAPDQATRLASTPNTTSVALPAGEEVELPRTRVFGAVPTIQPPPAAADNTLLFVVLAVVLFVGASLLGLAAFFVLRR